MHRIASSCSFTEVGTNQGGKARPQFYDGHATN